MSETKRVKRRGSHVPEPAGDAVKEHGTSHRTSSNHRTFCRLLTLQCGMFNALFYKVFGGGRKKQVCVDTDAHQSEGKVKLTDFGSRLINIWSSTD